MLPLGDASKGEIQIITDPSRMAEIEKAKGREVGIISKDRFRIWINDACVLSNGQERVFGRIVPTYALESSRGGVAIMPILPDGRVVLNCNFRHATRSWEIELPRGGIDPGESPQDAAKREVLEETGMVLANLKLLGEMVPDDGLYSLIVPVYTGNVVDRLDPEREAGEAIADNVFLTKSEIKQAFAKGFIEVEINGEKQRVPFRDPFLAYALLIHGM